MKKIRVDDLVYLRDQIDRGGLAALRVLGQPWPWSIARVCMAAPDDQSEPSTADLEKFRTNLENAIEHLRAHPMEEPSLPEGSESLRWVIAR